MTKTIRLRDQSFLQSINPDFQLWSNPRDFPKCTDTSWAPDNPFSGPTDLKQQHDAPQHDAMSQPCVAQDCKKTQFFNDAHEHHTCRSCKALAAKQFALATSDLVDCFTKAINYEPHWLRWDMTHMRTLANCFIKQFEDQTGAIASSCLLLIERWAYSDPAGHVHHPQLSLRVQSMYQPEHIFGQVHRLVRCQDRVRFWQWTMQREWRDDSTRSLSQEQLM